MDQNLTKTNADRIEVHGTISGLSMPDEQRVVGCIAALHASLNTFGKLWSPAIAEGWLMALRLESDITVAEFQSAASRWLTSERNFPTPADLFSLVRSQRQDLARQQELVDMAEYIRQESDAELAERNVARYGTPTPSREQIDARLSRLGVSILEPKLRESPEVFRTDRFDLEDPDQAERVRRQVEDARKAAGTG